MKLRKNCNDHLILSNLSLRVYVSSVRTRGVVLKKVFLRIAKFAGKHLYQSLFLKKVAGFTPAILLKKKLWHRCFPVNFTKF